jgi:hypothetical protein
MKAKTFGWDGMRTTTWWISNSSLKRWMKRKRTLGIWLLRLRMVKRWGYQDLDSYREGY